MPANVIYSCYSDCNSVCIPWKTQFILELEILFFPSVKWQYTSMASRKIDGEKKELCSYLSTGLRIESSEPPLILIVMRLPRLQEERMWFINRLHKELFGSWRTNKYLAGICTCSQLKPASPWQTHPDVSIDRGKARSDQQIDIVFGFSSTKPTYYCIA